LPDEGATVTSRLYFQLFFQRTFITFHGGSRVNQIAPSGGRPGDEPQRDVQGWTKNGPDRIQFSNHPGGCPVI